MGCLFSFVTQIDMTDGLSTAYYSWIGIFEGPHYRIYRNRQDKAVRSLYKAFTNPRLSLLLELSLFDIPPSPPMMFPLLL